jgi:uncharacterized protein YjbI with pentapeptide repeats
VTSGADLGQVDVDHVAQGVGGDLRDADLGGRGGVDPLVLGGVAKIGLDG